MQSHIAIVGATATGKSWLAMEIARRHPDVELVSIDSMQVYKGMDIGTAKPTVEERAEIPHHLIDLVEPDRNFDLMEFKDTAVGALRDIEQRGKRALLVGGTGLYLQSVIDDLKIPGQFPHIREQLNSEENTEALHRRLMELDPTAAQKMEPNNRRRVLRALEVTIGSGQPFSSFGPGMNAFPQTNFKLLGAWIPREIGRTRIDNRVDEMMQAGWLDEVRALTTRYQLSKTAAQALGYKELIKHLEGWSLDEAIAEIKQRTKAFARRQRVWFRRDPRITWFRAEQDARTLLPAMLRECEQHWSKSEVNSNSEPDRT